MNWHGVVVLVGLLACQTPRQEAAGDLSTGLADTLAATALRFATLHKPPGLAVGVIQDGKVLYRAGFGSTQVGGGQPVTPTTVFHMASVTKPFVATALVQLAEQGKVGLDQPVVSYLPYFRMKDASAKTITLRQALTHTAGFPDVTDYQWGKPEYDEGALERYVRGLADSALIFPPTTQWAYSNIGFEVLADVVAKASGVPFEDYLRREIFVPLGMGKTTLLMTDIDSAQMALGHTSDSAGTIVPAKAYPYNRRHAGSSTLHSNVDDMLRWANANLNRGTLDGKIILTPSAYGDLWKRERDMTADLTERAKQAGVALPFDSIAIGLSWFLPTRKGRQLVWHAGGDTGFRTDLLLVPAERLGIVVLTNTDSVDPGQLTTLLLDAIPVRH